MLEQFPAKLDGVIILFVKILVTELSNKEISKSYRLHVLLMVAYMFIYNTPLSLKTLTETNVLIPVCQNFFSSLVKYTEIEQFRCLIYGITALITTEAEHLHDVIKSGMPKIVESLIKLMHKYTKEREREKTEELEDQLSSTNEESEEYKIKKDHLDKLKQIAESEGHEEEGDEEDDYGDDDDYLWSRTDSFYYKSNLETKEAPLHFRDTLQELKEKSEDHYNSLVGVISEDNKALLESIIER